MLPDSDKGFNRYDISLTTLTPYISLFYFARYFGEVREAEINLLIIQFYTFPTTRTYSINRKYNYIYIISRILHIYSFFLIQFWNITKNYLKDKTVYTCNTLFNLNSFCRVCSLPFTRHGGTYVYPENIGCCCHACRRKTGHRNIDKRVSILLRVLTRPSL